MNTAVTLHADELSVDEALVGRMIREQLPAYAGLVVAVGRPAHGYPEHWSVVRWLDGEHPVVGRHPAESDGVLASDLVAVLQALQRPCRR